MSYASIIARGRLGIEAPEVCVEVFISRGLPGLALVGLPETAVKESKDRVRSALNHSGFDFPRHKIVVNLGPADLPKEGGRYDLAIAIGLLVASGQIPQEATNGYEFVGELSLAGDLRGVNGVLAAAIACQKSKRKLIVAQANELEAGLTGEGTAYIASNLNDVCSHLNEESILKTARKIENPQHHQYSKNLSEVKGQSFARRALEIAATGRHHLLMIGSPGSGKTMLAERLGGILPNLSTNQAKEIATIYSCRGQWNAKLWQQRPFRAPHHTSSAVALVGGGSRPLPGEISLAHHGILFLDELPQFERRVLEVLREPLESGKIVLSRAAYQTTYPAEFQLVAAMNPCPCGYADDPAHRCCCGKEQIARYQSKLSGPLLDRIDLQVRVQPVDHSILLNKQSAGESSETIRERVLKASTIQHKRQKCFNSQLSSHQIETHCAISKELQPFLLSAAQNLKLSARALHRLLRVSRTIADLAGSQDIEKYHIAEALAFRLAHQDQSNFKPS